MVRVGAISSERVIKGLQSRGLGMGYGLCKEG